VLAEWRTRVTAGWSRLSLRIEDSRMEKDVPVGSAVGVVVRADLGTLSPEDVSVEIYHGPLDAAGEIRDGKVVLARHESRDGGGDLFRAELPCRVTGRYGYSARILSRHADLVNPFTPLLLTWE
jgi:starch phosphorylase